MRKVFDFGKVAYNGGRKINPVTVTVCFNNGVFTASGAIYNSKKSDCLCCGQCLDEIAYFVSNAKFKEIYRLWKLYHLNDMHAGTKKQEEALEAVGLGSFATRYDECCNYLKSVNLFEDAGHKFGHEWLLWDIPEEDVNKINSLLAD